MNTSKIPSRWTYLDNQDIDKYITYLSQNYTKFKLRCTPYDEETHSGLEVTLSRGNSSIHINKAYSPRFDSNKGGNQSKLENVPDAFGAGDYGYAYDGYIINGIFVSIVGDTQQECNNAKKVHQLYLKIRSKTIPTKDEKYRRESIKQERQKKQQTEHIAQKTLLETMKTNGDISAMIYNKYMGKIK